MRKYLIAITIILSIILLIVLACIYYGGTLQTEPEIQSVSSDRLLSNGEWISLSSHDLDSLSNDIYTDNVSKVIASLEKGIPVILRVNDGFFDKSGKGNYITLSAFEPDGKVIAYTKSSNSFHKESVDFYLALETASSAFIITNEESLL